MEQKFEVGQFVHIDFKNGGNVFGEIVLYGDMTNELGTEKYYKVEIADGIYIEVYESQIENIYEGFTVRGYEKFLERISEKYELPSVNCDNHGKWLPLVWKILSDDEKDEFAAFFTSKEVVTDMFDIVFNLDKEFAKFTGKRESEPKESILNCFYINKSQRWH